MVFKCPILPIYISHHKNVLAVRYVHFSSSLPMESTAIADSSSQSQMPTNDSSSSSRQTTPGFPGDIDRTTTTLEFLSESLTEFEKMEKRNKYRRSSEAEHISQDRWIFCSTNTVFGNRTAMKKKKFVSSILSLASGCPLRAGHTTLAHFRFNARQLCQPGIRS
jgi:hypothetical protein